MAGKLRIAVLGMAHDHLWTNVMEMCAPRGIHVMVEKPKIMEAGLLSATSGTAVSLPLEGHLFRG